MKRNQESKTIDNAQLVYINGLIQLDDVDANDVSDGYHTFGQLYDCRLAYNVALFNEWSREHNMYNEGTLGCNIPILPKYNVHKSKKHHDGELCFGGGWFIVVAILPTGQITNHYKLEDWDLFKIPETEKALVEFDGHNTDDVISRLISL